MKAVQTGNTFRIYDNSMKTYDKLPPHAFLVNFNPMDGFYLTLYHDIEIKEPIYGEYSAKVEKVVKSFEKINRNLGVILSGNKGIGKTLFAKMLAKREMECGLPLIIVNTHYPGISEYLNNIDQQVIILFDEFDKTFDKDEHQTEMLTLFDGIAQGKKLFVITCNGLKNLNDFIVNRPGRFHYHFRFGYPSSSEIRTYLMQNLDEDYHDEINAVIGFCTRSLASFALG